MKESLVFVTIFGTCLIFLIGADLMNGYSLADALRTLYHSFAVTTAAEKLIIATAIALPFATPLRRRFSRTKPSRRKGS
ncbi:hypothetical protein BCM02_103188 [Paenibacillus methanolicus]|uniref:Uncharacterized protein n=1 Tax=Paenibacillus methanolicus TaxID=582686 RepID=A0A5S5CDY5_9BACL|nr:hypothetical protein BCM02_103188 [Paenibacillus methanolicus]